MAFLTYRNFDLLIDPAPGGYQARVIDSPAGQAAIRFALPPLLDAYRNHLALIGGAIRDLKSIHPALPAPSLDPKRFGSELYTTIFGGAVGVCLHRSLDRAQQEGAGLRIRLRLTYAPDLAALPWEYLFDTEHNRFLVLSEQTPLVRYMDVEHSEQPLQVNLPLRLLVMISDPTDVTPSLDGEREWARLTEALSELQTRGALVIERLPHATLGDLQRTLREGEYHLFHFIGHGWFDEPSGRGGLLLEDDTGHGHLLTVDKLAPLLHDHKPLRLAFLNACEGATADRVQPFAGVAQHLIEQQLPAVIAMQFPMSDRSAIALAQNFYRALADGYPVDAALTAARKAIFAIGSVMEWGTPVLFLRSSDGALFDLLDVLPRPPCPYPGIVPFTQADARSFFGRDDEIDKLCLALHYSNQLFIIGPSGSGKSSLIRAGLVPKLEKAEGDKWCICILRPGVSPLATLEEELRNRFISTQEPVSIPSSNAEKFLLVIDQFEELFVYASRADQITFVAHLKALRQNQWVRLLIIMRADFYPDLMNSDLWSIALSQRLEITPLHGDQLRQAIEKPAASVGVRLESGLLERLLADAADEPGVLPLLQETMVLLWQEEERRVLPLAAYVKLGKGGRSGLAVAMSTKADATLAGLRPPQQAIARRIFLRMVQFGEGRSDTRRQQRLTDLRSATDNIILFDDTLQQLANSRLLTFSGEADGGERKVDIAHEMLIVGWPTAQEWVRQRREAELTRRRLEEKAREWSRLGQGDGGILDADELVEAKRWLSGVDATDLGYSEQLNALIQSSRNKLQKEVLKRRVLSFVVLALVAIIVAAISSASIFYSQRQRVEIERNKAVQAQATAVAASIEAQKQAHAAATAQAQAETARSESERLKEQIRADQLAQAALVASQNHLPQRALLLSVAAAQAITPTLPSGLQSLLTLLGRIGGRVIIGHDKAVTSVAFSPNGKWLASGSVDTAIALWSLDNLDDDPLILRGHTDAISSVAFSPDGKWLASGSVDKTMRLWSLDNPGAAPLVFSGHEAPITSLAFSPNGKWLASGSDDMTIRLWRVGDPGVAPLILHGHEDFVTSVAFSPDSKRLASSSNDMTIRLWQVDNSSADPIILRGHEDFVRSVAFSSDGKWLASSSDDTTIRLWSLDNLSAAPTILSGHEDVVTSVAFSPDGKRLASSSDDTTIRLWQADNPSPGAIILQGHEDVVHSVAFSPDRKWLASGSADKTIRLWPMDNPKTEPLILRGHQDGISSVAFSPDGKWLASGSVDKTVRLWQIDNPSMEPLILQGHEGTIHSVAFSPDRKWVASGSDDMTIRLWQVDNPSAAPVILHGHEAVVRSVAFSPDGKWVASSSDDMTIRLWQVDNPSAAPVILHGHEAVITSVAFSVNGKWLASGSLDNTIRLWSLDKLSDVPVILHGHEAVVTPVAFSAVLFSTVTFSPDGKWLVSGSTDGTIRLWSVDSINNEPLILRSHEGTVTSVAFSPDGKRLANGSQDNTLGVWTMSVEQLVDHACQLTGRNFTLSEWQQYFPGKPYSPICPQWPAHPSVQGVSTSQLINTPPLLMNTAFTQTPATPTLPTATDIFTPTLLTDILTPIPSIPVAPTSTFTPLSTYTPTSSIRVPQIYQDDFSVNNGWDTWNDNVSAATVSDDRFNFVMHKAGYVFFSTNNSINVRDFHLSVEAIPLTNKTEKYGYGICFRHTEQGYCFGLSNKGEYELIIHPNGNKPIEWTFNSAIYTDRLNKIEVAAIGSRIDLGVNSVKLVSWNDDRFQEGKIRLYTYTSGDEATVQFNNLYIEDKIQK